MDREENILGTENIGKLIIKFGVPSLISLLVTSLYNIVDQIFIGRGVDYFGNGATNIVFPLMMTALAIALTIGDGTAAFLSLKLGEKKEAIAAKGVSTGILTSMVISMIFTGIVFILLPNLLDLFGCTDILRQYATTYARIITIGIPFFIIGASLNSIIRADGSPKYAMTTMTLGAIINIILDPIFILWLDMGMKGAALATIISQFITFILNIRYIGKFKSINIKKENGIFSRNLLKKIIKLGTSSFILHMSIVLVITILNNLLGKYGVQSKYGPEIPITVLGIVMKINQILNCFIIGIATGSLPIRGYNYGAKKYQRVKEALSKVIKFGLGINFVAFILFQSIPQKLISIFGQGDILYTEFAILTFRIFLLLCVLSSIQIVAGIFFQAIGKGSKSILLSLSRQILFFIPFLLILGKYFGIMGILYAGPVADGLAFILSGALLCKEVKSLNRLELNKE